MIRMAPPSARRDEAERPFWISFSDLMTALMVLFLVAMSVALLAVTHEISRTEAQKAARQADIDAWMNRLREATAAFPGVSVHGHTIDFGERARFDTDSHKLSEAQAGLLREVVPHILALARDPAGSRWLKRIVVEGFADARGSYLHNLNLSLQRSERVLCVLLAGPPAPAALTDGDRLQVRQLFRVSGASFNALKTSAEESRRIELRLEFLEPDESRAPERQQTLDKDNGCPLERA
jgi:flagellar motor protein MotB